MVQLNGNHAQGRGKIISKTDESWGLEWWGGSTLNFYVRQPGSQPGTQGTAFRGIQATICNTTACEAGWVRVAVSYSGTAGFASNIAMFANGQPQHALPNKEPGTWHGAAAATPDSGLITSGLAGIVLADVKLFSGGYPT